MILSLQLGNMESLKDFGECIISIQACVIKKFLQGFMAPKQKKKRKQGGEESSKAEEFDEEKRLAEEARVRKRIWNAMNMCQVCCEYKHLMLDFDLTRLCS